MLWFNRCRDIRRFEFNVYTEWGVSCGYDVVFLKCKRQPGHKGHHHGKKFTLTYGR